MTNGDTVVLAHRGECGGARSYEDLSSPFEAARIVLQPLCAEAVDTETVIPSLRLSAARAGRCLFVVPVMDGRLTEKCKPGWTGPAPCARCVLERWREVLGGDPVRAGGPRLERLRVDEEVEGEDYALVEFVRRNAPRFSFESSSPLAVTPVRFRFSGGAAALFLGEKLFVQSRSRALGEADARLLLAVAPPSGRSDVSEPVEPDIGALRAPNVLSAGASRPDDGRPLLNDDGLYEPGWVSWSRDLRWARRV